MGNNLMNDKKELDFDKMEKPQSVHLSRASYPHWQGKQWTEKPKSNDLSSFF